MVFSVSHRWRARDTFANVWATTAIDTDAEANRYCGRYSYRYSRSSYRYSRKSNRYQIHWQIHLRIRLHIQLQIQIQCLAAFATRRYNSQIVFNRMSTVKLLNSARRSPRGDKVDNSNNNSSNIIKDTTTTTATSERASSSQSFQWFEAFAVSCHKCICCLLSVSLVVFAFCNVIELNAAAACDIFTRCPPTVPTPPSSTPSLPPWAMAAPASHRKTSTSMQLMSCCCEPTSVCVCVYLNLYTCICSCVCICIYALELSVIVIVANVARPLMKADENEPNPLVIELMRQWDKSTKRLTKCRCFDFSLKYICILK